MGFPYLKGCGDLDPVGFLLKGDVQLKLSSRKTPSPHPYQTRSAGTPGLSLEGRRLPRHSKGEETICLGTCKLSKFTITGIKIWPCSILEIIFQWKTDESWHFHFKSWNNAQTIQKSALNQFCKIHTSFIPELGKNSLLGLQIWTLILIFEVL